MIAVHASFAYHLRHTITRIPFEVHTMRAFGLAAAAIAACACVLHAQGVPTPEFQIPAIREPHHFVKLDNKYVRVLDVTVPGYDSTLYHIHENPYFWISIGAATLRG